MHMKKKKVWNEKIDKEWSRTHEKPIRNKSKSEWEDYV